MINLNTQHIIDSYVASNSRVTIGEYVSKINISDFEKVAAILYYKDNYYYECAEDILNDAAILNNIMPYYPDYNYRYSPRVREYRIDFAIRTKGNLVMVDAIYESEPRRTVYYARLTPDKKVTLDDFYMYTSAEFTRINEVTNRAPDFVSPCNSRYWYDGDVVIRESDHWCNECYNIASCEWYIDEWERGTIVGKCNLSDFDKSSIKERYINESRVFSILNLKK